MGVLSNHGVDNRASQRVKGEANVEARVVHGSLQVIVTRECPLRCDYCQVATRPESMTPETLAGAVDLLFTSASSEVNLLFMGGDPPVRFDLVRQAVDLAERRASETGKRVRYSLATTGLTLERPMLDAFPAGSLDVNLNIDCLRPARSRPWSERPTPPVFTSEALRRLGLLERAGVPYCVGVEVEPTDVEGLRPDLEALAAAGVQRMQALFRLGVPWAEESATRFLAEIDQVLRSPLRPRLFNAMEPMDPLLLHDELVVDCDGSLYWWGAMFIERGFPELKDACRVGRVGDLSSLDGLQGSPAEVRRLLLGAYPPGSPRHRTLENNLELGLALCRACGHPDWTAEAPEPRQRTTAMTIEASKPRKIFLCSTNAGCPVNLPYTVQLHNYIEQNRWSMVALEDAETIVIVNCGSWIEYRKRVPATVSYLSQRYPDKDVVVTCCFVKQDMVHAPNVHYIHYSDKDELDRLLAPTIPLREIASTSTPEDDQKVGALHDDKAKFDVPYNVTVATGCLNHCAFCNQKVIFPILSSMPLDEIVAECLDGLAKGYTHFVIGGADVSSYGHDLGLDLVDLFEALFSRVLRPNPGLVVGFWALEPSGFIRRFDALKPYFAEGRISWMRLPVQSGSNSVLGSMNRNYTVEEVLGVLGELRRVAPGLRIDTDLLFCYPTETEVDFQASLALIDAFDDVSLLVFGRHENTKAYALVDVFDAEEKARRIALIEALSKAARETTRSGGAQGHPVVEIKLPSTLGDSTFFVLEDGVCSGGCASCPQGSPDVPPTAAPPKRWDDEPEVELAPGPGAAFPAAAEPEWDLADPDVARLLTVEQVLAGKGLELRRARDRLDLVFPDDAQAGGSSTVSVAKVDGSVPCWARVGGLSLWHADSVLTPRTSRVLNGLKRLLQAP